MAIQISGTTVINDNRELENVQISQLALFGTGLDTDNPGTTINYTNPSESTTNANTAGGGLYIRDSTFTWYSRLPTNASWANAVTLVCAKTPTGGSSVGTQLDTVQDGDTLLVYINSSNYAIYEVDDTSIFSSSYARFFDVDLVSSAGNFAVATDGALQLQFGFAKITTTLTKTNPTAARTITLPNASGTVALTSDVGGGATGGGSDEVFYENGQTVTTNYTITNNKNAMSAGPITVNSGVTVTVGSGEAWTVV